MRGELIIYDVTVYLYALSVLFYFLDFLRSNKKINRVAFALLCFVWLLQTAFLILRFMERDFIPVFPMFDTLIFYAWALVTFSIVINSLFRMQLFVLLANLIGFTMVAISLFIAQDEPTLISQQLISELLFIHVTFALLAYSFFLLTFLLALLYLLLNDLLKKKRWNKIVQRAPSLSRLEQLLYWGNAFGVVFLLLSLILGSIWAYEQSVSQFWFDPKIGTSFLVLFVYCYIVYRRTISHWSGKSLAVCNVIALSTVLLNIFVSNVGISFHRW